MDGFSVFCSLYHCEGTVYIDDSVQGKIIEKYETTPSADIAIRDFFNSELGNNEEYNVFLYNCRDYIQSLFNAIKRVY